MTEKRRGRQTPTVGVTLPYQDTKGHEAVEIYQRTGREAQEWQAGLIYDMMACEEDGTWVHSRFGYSVPRQNGKNECVAIRELWGLIHGERMLHTAHRTATSRSAWERLVMLLENAGIREEKGDVKVGYKSGKSKGQEFIYMNEELGGGRLAFRTRSTTGGLGETFDLLIIDEAQEYQDDQESALKYTIVSSDNPQTIFLGTPPTPYSSGTIFPKLRQAILTGERKHAGWAEWSVTEQTDPNDVDAWYETNPNLGFKLSERAIEDEIGQDAVDFNIQRLGLWIQYNQQSAISLAEWRKLEVDTLPELTGPVAFGVKFAVDGTSVSLSLTVKTADDKIFLEGIGCRLMRDGVGWIVEWLKACDYTRVAVDGAAGAELLTAAMKEAKLKAPYIVKKQEFIDANALFTQSIYDGTLQHMAQPGMEQIVSNCEKRAIGTGGGFGYRSIRVGADISLLDSAVLAVWTAEKFKRRRQRVSY